MKRNWDVIRKILLKVESLPDEYSVILASDFEIDQETVAYHMRILIQAGLIEGECNAAFSPAQCHITGLTWDGHEFLDRIKRENVWNKVKETARAKSIDLSFDIIKTIASSLLIQIAKGG